MQCARSCRVGSRQRSRIGTCGPGRPTPRCNYVRTDTGRYDRTISVRGGGRSAYSNQRRRPGYERRRCGGQTSSRSNSNSIGPPHARHATGHTGSPKLTHARSAIERYSRGRSPLRRSLPDLTGVGARLAMDSARTFATRLLLVRTPGTLRARFPRIARTNAGRNPPRSQPVPFSTRYAS